MALKTASEMRVVSDKGVDFVIRRALEVIENHANEGKYSCNLHITDFSNTVKNKLIPLLEELGYFVRSDYYSIEVSW